MRGLMYLLAILPLCGQAHHSRSAFDLDAVIIVEGTVAEVGWTNPHYYLKLREDADSGEVSWLFEGHSIPGLVRNGWSKTSVAVGDRVRVAANPNKDADTRFALLAHLTRTDGTTLYSFKQSPAAEASPLPPLAPATDMEGTWRVIRSLRANLVSVVEPPRDWPLQPLAEQQVSHFNLRDDPALRCERLGLPRMLTWPYAQRWRKSDGGYQVEVEHSIEHRRILSSAGEAQDDHGISVGTTMADGGYQIVTSGFSSQDWGNARGISSSEQKKITERYTLVDEGYRLHLEITLEDPLYLREPVTISADFRKVHDYNFGEDPPCDVATATRHLEYER